MGCLHSSVNRIHTEHTFNAEDILCLTQTWAILKSHDIVKFADDVFLRIINRNSYLRQFWTSKLSIDANNYDFSEGESCLRTDISWHIGLRDHSIHLVSIFDQLLSSVKDENLLLIKIRSLRLLANLSILENDSFEVMNQCVIEIIRERFHLLELDFTNDYERAWKKFLSFVIRRLLEKDNTVREPTKIIISPATVIDQPSNNTFNS